MENGFKLVPTERGDKAPRAEFRLHMHIFRHGKKDGGHDVTPEVDMAMALKPEGRIQAHEKGVELKTAGGAISGSSRARTRETAMHVAHANNPEVTGEESYDELVEKLGITPWVNKAFDMPFSKDDPNFPIINQKSDEGIFFKWAAEEADRALKDGDASKTIYGIQARKVAAVVDRFATIASKMADRAERAKERGEDAETEREQVMGTHAGVNESFVAEVLRRMHGDEERQKMLNILPNGVSETQGSDIDIVATSGEEPRVHILFVGGKDQKYSFNEDVPLSVIKDIVRDFSPHEEQS
jgi:broad specificity phosphatase PhoE